MWRRYRERGKGLKQPWLVLWVAFRKIDLEFTLAVHDGPIPDPDARLGRELMALK
jgi:hypothetical protein